MKNLNVENNAVRFFLHECVCLLVFSIQIMYMWLSTTELVSTVQFMYSAADSTTA